MRCSDFLNAIDSTRSDVWGKYGSRADVLREIAPHGRGYFEELEQRAKEEEKKPLVFISCGQSHPKEIQLGKDLAAKVSELTQLEAYFAENRNTLAGLSNDIFRALGHCPG